jgi:hypothetical protein
MANDKFLLASLVADIRQHCRAEVRGGCGSCMTKPECERSLAPLIDSLLNTALAMEKMEREQVRQTANVKTGFAAPGRFHAVVNQLGSVVMDCGRIKPIDTIDGAVRCLALLD